MLLLNWVANGLGTILNVVTEAAQYVVYQIRNAYDAYQNRGGVTREQVTDKAKFLEERLRQVNEELMHLRNRFMARGNLSDKERRRSQQLIEERQELNEESMQFKEVRAAEKILDEEDLIENIEIDMDTTHILQYNGFVDTMGKKCPQCGRRMKLQWNRAVNLPSPRDFYWGCTGWYITRRNGRACVQKERFQRSDLSIMTNLSEPELTLTADEFGRITSDQSAQEMIYSRVDDMLSDMKREKKGVKLATCPVHGEHLQLRRKSKPLGLLDTYFLACKYWLPNDQGCSFIEKLKSGAQLAALLKSETKRGIL